MFCQYDLFIKEERAVRLTWAKSIFDGEYDNISYYAYLGDCKKAYIDEKNRIIYCKSGDGLWDTYQKTSECIKQLLDNNIEFDYIFRTNTSTVNNIGLLDYFVNHLKTENVVYGGEYYCIGVPCPTNAFVYLRGNSLLLPRRYCELIVEWDKYMRIPFQGFADDNIIGNVINTYHLLRYEPYIDYVKSYPFGFYKCYAGDEKNKSNGCCHWNNQDDTYDFLKNFISIQIKSFSEYTKDRKMEEEVEKMAHISSIVNIKKDDYKDELEYIANYFKNPYFYYYNKKKDIAKYVRIRDAVKNYPIYDKVYYFNVN